MKNIISLYFRIPNVPFICTLLFSLLFLVICLINVCVCVCVLWSRYLVHRLAHKWPKKAVVSQVQSTNYLHYPLEAKDPLTLLGLGSVQSKNKH